MRKRRLYVFSPVDIFGRPFGGSLDVMERLKWASNWYNRVIVFCPGQDASIKRKKIMGRRVIVVYGRKRLNLMLAIFTSAAVAWKPIFWMSRRRVSDQAATFLFEGFLTIFMFPQIFIAKHGNLRRKIRVHNDEALFHLDRADTETNRVLGWALRVEAARLWVLERLFYARAAFDRCFISNAESLRFGLKTRDVAIPYLPTVSVLQTEMKRSAMARSIVTVANFGLADNRRAICSFLDQYLPQMQERGFSVVIGGYGSELLSSQYAAEPGVQIRGALSAEEETQLYSQALCCLVASNNRAGYKTRISTALANGLVPVLHGRGAEANAQDAMLSLRSSQLVRMIDDGTLFNLSCEINGGRYNQLVDTAKLDYQGFLFS
jgi:hypothetical protein